MIGIPIAAVRRRTARFGSPDAAGFGAGCSAFSVGASDGSDMHAARDEGGRIGQTPFRRCAWYLAEAPVARLICGEGLEEIVLAEVGPERVREVHLRVGSRPQKEVADAELA